jgi:hypothetical protein
MTTSLGRSKDLPDARLVEGFRLFLRYVRAAIDYLSFRKSADIFSV